MAGVNKDGRKRKHRRVAYGDAIKAINTHFIKVFQRYLGDKWSWEDTIRLAFLADQRDVLFCKAKQDLELDGKYVRSYGKQIVRRVKKGDPVIVRTDATKPAHNEVIFKGQYFLLGQLQIERLKEKLEVIL